MPKRLIATLAVLAAVSAAALAAGSGPAARADPTVGPSGSTGAQTCGPICYVTPSGSPDATCSSPTTDPCALATAVADAVSGATIELNAGDYRNISSTISDSGRVLHFVGSGGRASLFGTVGGGALVSLDTPGSSLEDLYVENDDPSGIALSLGLGSGAVTADRVLATAQGQACQFGGGVTLTDSVCSSSGSAPSAPVLETTGSNTLVNDDIWGAGEGSGIKGDGGADTVVNTIISANNGKIGGGADLLASATMTFNVSYSNYLLEEGPSGSTFNNSNNETNTPAQLQSDFQEQPGSPTIGEGANDSRGGSVDLAGNTRQTPTSYYFSYGPTPAVGTQTPTGTLTTTDIGADQLQAQAQAQIVGPSAIGEDSATLVGQVFPDNAGIAHTVMAPVSGLIPGKTYYFELVANGFTSPQQGSFTPGSSNGSSTGGGGSYVYNPGGSGATGGGTYNGGPTARTASISATSAHVSNHAVAIQVSCPGQAICAGNLQLLVSVFFKAKVHGKLRKEQKSVIVANGLYAVPAASTAKATLRLTPNGTKLLASHHGRLAGKLEITPGDGSGTFEQNLALTASVTHQAKPKKHAAKPKKHPAKPKKH
ncbi:MAG TPA: hypothetical protein VID68_05765 [Solirubrobacteraceae bacterium]|jgi:hypothetical protein